MQNAIGIEPDNQLTSCRVNIGKLDSVNKKSYTRRSEPLISESSILKLIMWPDMRNLTFIGAEPDTIVHLAIYLDPLFYNQIPTLISVSGTTLIAMKVVLITCEFARGQEDLLHSPVRLYSLRQNLDDFVWDLYWKKITELLFF